MPITNQATPSPVLRRPARKRIAGVAAIAAGALTLGMAASANAATVDLVDEGFDTPDPSGETFPDWTTSGQCGLLGPVLLQCEALDDVADAAGDPPPALRVADDALIAAGALSLEGTRAASREIIAQAGTVDLRFDTQLTFAGLTAVSIPNVTVRALLVQGTAEPLLVAEQEVEVEPLATGDFQSALVQITGAVPDGRLVAGEAYELRLEADLPDIDAAAEGSSAAIFDNVLLTAVTPDPAPPGGDPGAPGGPGTPGGPGGGDPGGGGPGSGPGTGPGSGPGSGPSGQTGAGGLGSCTLDSARVADQARGQGDPDAVELSRQQLLINQRISQAGVRRVNTVLDKFMAGFTGTDFRDCSIGGVDFAPAFRTAVAGDAAASGANTGARSARSTPSRVADARDPDSVELSRQQLLINQRISQAAVRRVNAVRERIDAMQAGDIRGGALGAMPLDTGMRRGLAGGAPAGGASPSLEFTGLAIAAPGARDPGSVRLSSAQLLINQRISQAAVRRINQVNAELAAGLSGGNVTDGQLSRAHLAPPVQLGR